MQERLEEQRREREVKLLEQGVRRSKRITDTNNTEANETDYEIPNNLNEAKESID